MKGENKILIARNLGITFGGLKAVSGFDLELGKNELVGLIGPNGAGKTTAFNLLTGVYQPTEGEYYLDGQLISGKKSYQLVKQGIARTFQNIRLFKHLQVIENVMIACNHQMKYSIPSAIFRLKSYWREEEDVRKKSMELLKVFGLEDFAEYKADNLPYGQQRKLEIARALATNPKVLLLDEPAAGMNPTETQELMDTISLIRDKFDISILLIEHDMSLVLGICERVIVLDYGKIISAGNPKDVVNDPKVIAAYIGADETEGDIDA